MKRWIVAALVLALWLMLAGCSTGKVDSQKIAEAKIDNKMFMTISDEYCGLVLVDKSTRVMYWLSDGGYSHGILTLLVNPDGTPRIWEGI
jgi:hypothetical protein